jgi:hypothetical protein
VLAGAPEVGACRLARPSLYVRGATRQRPSSQTTFLGTGFGDSFEDFRGGLRVLQGKGAASTEAGQIAGKALYQALFPHHVAGGRSLHGKEGVYGSSPSEGSTKGQQMAFSARRDHSNSLASLSPRPLPSVAGGRRSWRE